MAISGSSLLDKSIRIYSGNTPTPFYVAMFQTVIQSLPLREPRPETQYQLDAGKVSNFVIPYITPEDQLVPFQPVTFSAVMHVSSDYLEMLDVFGNARRQSPWTIGGDTWQAVASTAIGTRQDVNGNAVNAFPPKDQELLDGMVNIYVQYAASADAQAGETFVVGYLGCTPTVYNLNDEGNGLITANIDAQVYGNIDPTLSAFPAGTESTPT